jgi:hypothetical protein
MFKKLLGTVHEPILPLLLLAGEWLLEGDAISECTLVRRKRRTLRVGV